MQFRRIAKSAPMHMPGVGCAVTFVAGSSALILEKAWSPSLVAHDGSVLWSGRRVRARRGLRATPLVGRPASTEIRELNRRRFLRDYPRRRAVAENGRCVTSDGAALGKMSKRSSVSTSQGTHSQGLIIARAMPLWDTVLIALVVGSTILFCFWAHIRAAGGDS
jgi:hypothetical protein